MIEEKAQVRLIISLWQNILKPRHTILIFDGKISIY